MAENNEMFERIDKFITDLLSGDIEINYLRAEKLEYYEISKGILGTTKKDAQGRMPSHLGTAISRYVETKDNPALRIVTSYECMRYIVWAYTHDVIKKTGLKNRIKEFEKENAQLKEEKDKLQKENQRLSLLNDALQNAMDRFGPRVKDDETQSGEEE